MRRQQIKRLLSLIGLMSTHRVQANSAKVNGADFYPAVKSDYTLEFPRDHGAHEQFRTEWWYITGWLNASDVKQAKASFGFQVTFFRSRTRHPEDNPSRFAPKQLLLGHVAIAYPPLNTLLHDEMAMRAQSSIAGYSTADCAIALNQHTKKWRLQRNQNDSYVVAIEGAGSGSDRFSMQLLLTPPNSGQLSKPWLQGTASSGFSQKGPKPAQASYYYSRPQLKTGGSLQFNQQNKTTQFAVDGISWFDHEWSSELLDPQAVGWDWLGLNLLDGSALTIFRVRRSNDDSPTASLHQYAALKESKALDASPTYYRAIWKPRLRWVSPKTSTSYPIQWEIQLISIQSDLLVKTLQIIPLMQDQELDGRRSTGIIYWEGAVRVYEDLSLQKLSGVGYLELTGYHQAVKL